MRLPNRIRLNLVITKDFHIFHLQYYPKRRMTQSMDQKPQTSLQSFSLLSLLASNSITSSPHDLCYYIYIYRRYIVKRRRRIDMRRFSLVFSVCHKDWGAVKLHFHGWTQILIRFFNRKITYLPIYYARGPFGKGTLP